VKRHQERAIDQFRLRLAGLFLLKHALAALAIWAFLTGFAVLILRFLGVSALPLLWATLGTLPFAFIPALLLTLVGCRAAQRSEPSSTGTASVVAC
jgi:hypothetical protein